MKRLRFKDSQIMEALNRVNANLVMLELCREPDIREAAFYKRCSKCGGINIPIIARVKEVELENPRLRNMYVEEKLKAEIVQEALEQKAVKPSRLPGMPQRAVQERGVSVRPACESFNVNRTCNRYLTKWDPKNDEIANWLLRLTENPRGWGFGLCFLYLRNVKETAWNHRHVYRIDRNLKLNLRIKPRKRLIRQKHPIARFD